MDAVRALQELYNTACDTARDIFHTGQWERYAEVTYPKLIIDVLDWQPVDRTYSFGYVDGPGTYSAVLSKPGSSPTTCASRSPRSRPTTGAK